MKKIAIIGAGNVGIAAAKALLESPDFELCGFVRREEKAVSDFEKIPVGKSVFDFPEKPDGALVCLPSMPRRSSATPTICGFPTFILI